MAERSDLLWRPLTEGRKLDPKGRLFERVAKRGLPMRVDKDAAPYFQALVDANDAAAGPAAEVLKLIQEHGEIELYIEAP